MCKEYWINKGFTEDEAIIKVRDVQIKNSNKNSVKLENELQFYIDQVISEGFSGNYAIRLARERRKKEIKRLSPTCIELWVNKGMTEDEAIYYIKSKRPNNIEYWLLKEFNEDEAKIKVSEFQSNASKCVKKICSDTNIQYFIDRGFSPEEAKEKLKERQTTFSLEKCISRYGEEKGYEIFINRQEKWQNTLNSKTKEEIDDINKRKAVTLETMIIKYGEEEGTRKYKEYREKNTPGYSKISQELFFKILEFINDKENVKFAEYNKEWFQHDYSNNGIKIYFYDFKYNNKIIEYNGDLNHANPEMFNENDHPNFYNKEQTSKEIWDYDERKINLVKDKGYDVLLIWDKNYKKNKEEVLKQCLTFLNL